MRYIILALIPALSLFLETTLLPLLHIRGLGPDLILIGVVFFAILEGEGKGARYGLLCGLFQDLYLGRFIGLSALMLCLVGYLAGQFRRHMFPQNILTPMLAVLASTLVNQAGSILILSVLQVPVNLGSAAAGGLLAQAVYNVVVAVPLYIWYYKSYSRGWLRPSGKR